MSAITVHHCDCVVGMRSYVPDGTVALCITSPPYNVEMSYSAYDDSRPDVEYLSMLSDAWSECHRVLVPGGRICVVVPHGVNRNPYRPVASRVSGQLAELFVLRGQITWDKQTTGNRCSWGTWRSPRNPVLRDTTETVLVASKPGTFDVPTGWLQQDGRHNVSPWLDRDTFTRLTRDRWEIRPETRRLGHPCPFPEQLVENLIRLYAYSGATVLDPFCGSGTVGVVAKRMGCNAVLFDVDEEYCRLARDRCNATETRQATAPQTERPSGYDERSELTMRKGEITMTNLPETVISNNGFDFDSVNLDDLAMTQDYETLLGLERPLVNVPVHKPPKTDFIRVHPDPAWRRTFVVFEEPEQRLAYIVMPAVAHIVENVAKPRILFTGITRGGTVFLWPVSPPSADGRINSWTQSALNAVEAAKLRWVRVVANMSVGGYDQILPSGDIPEPTWPDTTFYELIKIAFQDRVIASPDHPILQRLGGA